MYTMHVIITALQMIKKWRAIDDLLRCNEPDIMIFYTDGHVCIWPAYNIGGLYGNYRKTHRQQGKVGI